MDLEGTTPPVPSSSPGIDNMDISPLPHKQPYFLAQVTLPSPSPEATPDEQSMSDDHLSPHELPTPLAQPVQAPSFLQLPEYVPSTPLFPAALLTVTTDADNVPSAAQASLAPSRTTLPPAYLCNVHTVQNPHCRLSASAMSQPQTSPARRRRV